VTFKVKATGRRHRKRTIRNFKVRAPVGTLYCYSGSFRQYFSTSFAFPKVKVKGSHISASRTTSSSGPDNGDSFEIDVTSGHFSGKKHARGAVDQEFYDSHGVNDCGTGTLDWSAKRRH
jgi:hypothetical protein